MRARAGFLFSHPLKHNYSCCHPLALQIGPVGLWLGIWPGSSKSIGLLARQRVRNANDLIIKHVATRVNTNWPRRVSVSVTADGSGLPSDKAWEAITKYVRKMWSTSGAGLLVGQIQECFSTQMHLLCTKNIRKAKPFCLAAFYLSKSFIF